MFTESFDWYVCEGDTIECTKDGFTITASVIRDDSFHINDTDCHSTDQDVTGCTDEQFIKLMEARAAWLNDEWFYCGVSLSIYKCGVCLSEYAASLWGLDANYPGSDNSHITEIANELLDETIAEGKQVLAELTKEEI